ncbi:hypothetical protein [Saccharospirillum salsuginis]|uniref:Uncharacterized protein n=1 Tax=Saccharospirillum salsuginis TaxID=418750 RepID=A0A918KMD8_9GAMM|nr:hypothetical protein [Saccharospirillum salsuginis]GGX68494.1 hypothetical protein GCM10007392_40080 [Saccharospirillum salsuginis]
MQPIPREQLPFNENLEVVIQGPDFFQLTLPVAFLWTSNEGVCFVEAGYYQNKRRPSAQCALGAVEIEADSVSVLARDGSHYRFCRPSNWVVSTVLRQWRDWRQSQGLTLEMERQRLWAQLKQSMQPLQVDRA